MRFLFGLFAICLSALVSAASINKIVVFGDSLSDNGNLYEYMQHQIPESPPYYEGRFSDGPIWVERLAESVFPKNPKDHLLDYAFGGAGISEDDEDDVLLTLKKEINGYLVSHQNKADPASLYIVWIGANNYLALPENSEEALTIVNQGLVHSLERLANAGARQVLVVNLPDLGKTPAAAGFDARDALSYLSKEHNRRLFESIKTLEVNYPHVKWIHYDVGTKLDEILNEPESYGFNNITETCYDALMDKSQKPSLLQMVASVNASQRVDNCEGYLFFDPVHPTSVAHKIIADKARTLLETEGVHLK